MKAGWAGKKLGEVCSFDKVQGLHRGLPYVGLEDIESHTARFIGSTAPVEVKSSTFRFSTTHVLYGRLRPYLNKVWAPDFDGHCSTEIFPLRPKRELLRKFLLFWLLSDRTRERINATCTGARMPRAQMTEVLDFEIPVPPLAEQQRIVDVLDRAFAGLAVAKANAEQNLRNARALFDSHREAVLTQRGPGWSTMALSEICDIKHGYAFEGEYFGPVGEYVLLTPGNFFERGGYRDRAGKQKFYTGEIPFDFVLTKGDLLLAMTEQAVGLLGSPLLVPESNKFLHNQRLGLVGQKAGVAWTNQFFFHVFNTNYVRRAIHHSASGVKVRHTSPRKIGDVVVSFPASLQEQYRIATTLASLAEATQRLALIYEQKIDALEALKKSMLREAFSGRL